ncbi:hypothetical protein [Sagittula salina]|uniref:Uncharacterized protein n=1 Tax=Sagittula salina TaxID=2820268 RepID=A0A940MMB6_9RHOB|nr:hypothetical protein [Sagittula salina]MBP0481321.1 hypothetical protein [Sagittula salina]
MRHVALFLSLALAAPAPLAAWETPSRGTATRGALMDAMRPHAEWIFGAPLVFRVDELRVDGDVAFAMLDPLRPDGRAMTQADLRPGHGADDLFEFGGPSIQALYQRSGDTWVAVHWEIGATDAWWYWPPLCPVWWSVIPDACAN